MKVIFSVIITAIVFFSAGLLAGNIVDLNTLNKLDKPEIEMISQPITNDIRNYTGRASVRIPAVDEEGSGVVTTLNVNVVEGSGRILTNIDRLLFWVDTQNSIRSARNVAEQVTGVDLSKFDIVYTVEAEASVIEGGSAGASLAIATIASIQNISLRDDVMITGTINDDGTIGPVGEVLAKAVAAKDVNSSLFLVPERQSTWRNYKSERTCKKIGAAEICDIKTVPERINIGEQVGIDVMEVSNIEEALELFKII